MKMQNFFRSGEKGFTLVEVLIVVAILGVLAAVIIPNLGSMVGTADVAAANTEADIVRTGMLAYHAEYGNWPTAQTQLDPYIEKEIKGTYTWDTTSGEITTATGWDLTWTNGMWEK